LGLVLVVFLVLTPSIGQWNVQTAGGFGARLDAVGSVVKDPDAVLRGVDSSGLRPWKGQKKAARKVGHGFKKVFRDVRREGGVLAKLETIDDGDQSVLSGLQRGAQVGLHGVHGEIM
jgi:hypothetical protein